MHIRAADTMVREVMREKLALLGWRFEWDSSYKRFGCCFFRQKLISMSWRLTVANDEAEVRDTILHEIAHALVGRGNGHNWKWKRKACEVGAKPISCCGSNVKWAAAPWRGICQNPKCRYEHRAYRAPRGAHFCRKCKGTAPLEQRVVHWRTAA